MPPVNSIKPLRTRTRSPSCGQALVRPSLASSLQGPRRWNRRGWRGLARAPKAAAPDCSFQIDSGLPSRPGSPGAPCGGAGAKLSGGASEGGASERAALRGLERSLGWVEDDGVGEDEVGRDQADGHLQGGA